MCRLIENMVQLSHMVVTLSEALEKEVSSAAKSHGYASEKSFIEDALKHRILLLKKGKFLAGARTVREALERKGLSEKGILEDFESSRG